MEKEIKLHDFFKGIKKRLLLIVAIACLAMMASWGYSKYQVKKARPVYQSSATYWLGLDNQSSLVNAIPFIAKDPTVLGAVEQKLALNRPADVLSNQITATMATDSPILTIAVIDPNPTLAASIANTTGTVFLQQIGFLFGLYNNKLLADAKPAASPINKPSGAHLSLALGGGIVIGIGLALLLESLDDAVQSAREVERLFSLPVLGCVSKLSRRNTKGRIRRKRSTARAAVKGGALNVLKEETNPN